MLKNNFLHVKKILIISETDNNGGGGFVAARHLHIKDIIRKSSLIPIEWRFLQTMSLNSKEKIGFGSYLIISESDLKNKIH